MTSKRVVLFCYFCLIYVTFAQTNLNSTTTQGREQPCNCYMLGTIEDYNGKSACDANGYCECLDNVIGRNCDACRRGHYGILLGNGCQKCDCDPNGAEDVNCHQLTGQCHCKIGFTGVKCNMCDLSIDESLLNCTKPCDKYRSENPDFPDENGNCKCLANATGVRCAECMDNYFFNNATLTCTVCDNCYQLFNETLQNAKNQLENLTKLIDTQQNQNKGTLHYDFLLKLKTLNNNICALLNKLNKKPLVIRITKLKHLTTILDFIENGAKDLALYLNGYINWKYLETKFDEVNATATNLEKELHTLRTETPAKVTKLQNVAKDVLNAATKLETNLDKHTNESTTLLADATDYYVLTNLTVIQIKKNINELKEFVEAHKKQLSQANTLLKLAKNAQSDSITNKQTAKALKEEAEKLTLPADSKEIEDLSGYFKEKFEDLSPAIAKAKQKYDLVNEINKLLDEISKSNEHILKQQEKMDDLYDNAEHKTNELEKQYQDLQESVKQLYANMDTLDEKINQLNKDINERQANIQEHQNNLEQQKENADKAAQDNTKLEEQKQFLLEVLEEFEKLKEDRKKIKQDIDDINELIKRRKELQALIDEAEQALEEFKTNDYNDLIDTMKELIEFLKLIPVDHFKKMEQLINEYELYFHEYELLWNEKKLLEKEVEKYAKLYEYYTSSTFCPRKFDVES